MTSDEFSGGVGAEASQQLAEGRRRAEEVGSIDKHRSWPLKAQME